MYKTDLNSIVLNVMVYIQISLFVNYSFILYILQYVL